MTSVQSKKELNNEFKDVKYILTSSMRTKLLLAVYKTPKNLDELRTELQKPSATILHGLKELETINLVRKSQKYYELTSNGHLLTTNLIKLIDNWYSLSKNESFWNNHDLSDIPEETVRKIYLLKDAEYICSTTSDLSISFNKYIQLISKAKTLKLLLPIYSENHLKHIVNLLNEGKLEKLELIVSEEIYNSIRKNKTFKKDLLENEKVNLTTIEKNFKIFLTCSEEFISLTLFFKDGHYDDSQILIANDENAKKWAFSILKKFKRGLFES